VLARQPECSIIPTNEQERKEMATDLVTYLSFDGQCEAAFKHYEKSLGGKILMMARDAGAPADAGVPRIPETESRIMHVRLQIGDSILDGWRRAATVCLEATGLLREQSN
jgi:hypothetical protein